MTGSGDDSQKHKSDDAAKYLAESFFGLNLNPADVGGEVLFDDYDDARPAHKAGDSENQSSADLDKSAPLFASAAAENSIAVSVPNRFEENLDDLIVFSDDDDDDDDNQVDEEDDDEDDDENFDFGDDDDDDEEEDELDDDEDFDEDEEDDEEEEEDEDELDDAELDFGDDVMDPAPKKTVPVAHESRGARDERGGGSRDVQRPASGQRGARPDERPAGRGGRSHESTTARADSRGSDRPPAAKADAGRKSLPADDKYWNELDGWVWDDEAKKKPAAVAASRPSASDDDDDDDDDDDVTGASPAARAVDDEDAPKRRRGRRRGGRGRGRGRRDEKETAAPVSQTSDSPHGNVDFDDDFNEIMFEEDQEDFVSVSAGSAKAQRRIQDEPEPSDARKRNPDDDDEDTDDDVERSETGDGRSSGAQRGRRGRRGRGRGREDVREPLRADERPAARSPRPVRDEDDMDDDIVDDDVELSDFGDQDDEVPPRRREESRGERPPRSQGQGRGRGQRGREPRPAESTERPRRPPAKEPRSPVAGNEADSRRGPRPPRVAAEFQDIPTWEEAIGSLAIRTPTEEHARRAESRGRRDGGRPPRRRN